MFCATSSSSSLSSSSVRSASCLFLPLLAKLSTSIGSEVIFDATVLCQILLHDRVSVTVSRFTSLNFDFVLCCYQFSQILLLEVWLHLCVSCVESSSSGSPAFRNFGLSRSECEFFSCTLAHGNSGGSGSLRARFVGVINSIRLKSIMCSGSC